MITQSSAAINRLRPNLVAATFLFVLVMFAPVSHAGALGFTILAGIAGIAGFASVQKPIALTNFPIAVWTLFLFLIWAATTSLWSPYEDTQPVTNPIKLLLGAGLFLGVFLLPASLSKPFKNKMAHFLAFVGFVTLSLLLFDQITGYALIDLFDPLDEGQHPEKRQHIIYQNLSHSVTILALLVPIITPRLWQEGRTGKGLAVIFLVGVIVSAILGKLAAGALAVGAAALFMIIARHWPKRAVKAVMALAIASIMFAPLAGYAMQKVPQSTKENVADSWEHRIEMWSYVSEKIGEKPFFGHGFDASRTFDRKYDGMSVNGKPYEQTIISLHPHNSGLQVWVETGAIGALLFSLFLFMLQKKLTSYVEKDSYSAVYIAGYVAAALTICTLTYGVWQEWWWGALIFIGALIPIVKMNTE
ncbi:MAG: O-antigen ligase family protein [Hellea sp.]|nr:O-antigen ligase family protein [Hellea sp.]